MSGIARGAFVDVKKQAQAAATNEEITRRRVEALELRISDDEIAVAKLLNRGFLSRLKWLVFGR